MRVTVTAAFRDRLTWRAYGVGEEYEGDEARVSELASMGCVTDDSATEDGGLTDLTVAELKALCDERGVDYPRKATKAQLLSLLAE